MADKMQKGREARGERAGCVKLTEGQVEKILASPKIAREIAAEFGVGKSTVNKIRSGVNWKHVPRPDMPGAP
jgi:DNA invertase Pin-like site-specific DNA recombinase